MFNVRERCELKPLAKQGPFARPFFVEIAVNIFKPKNVGVTIFLMDEDGTEKKLAEGTYELKMETIQKIKDELKGQ